MASKEQMPDPKGPQTAGQGVHPALRKLWTEYVFPIGIALLAALLIRTSLVEAFRIPSGSMIPTLAIGDHIFVDKLSYRLEIPYRIFQFRVPAGGKTLIHWGEPSRGDVAVFRYPRDPMLDYVKRIVAIPGDTVEVRNNRLVINGVEQSRRHTGVRHYKDRMCYEGLAFGAVEINVDGQEYSVQTTPGVQELENFGPVTVPPESYFAMGDNRDNSEDSRVWGFVPYDNLKGRAMFSWLSYDKCGSLSHKFRWGRFFRKVHRLSAQDVEESK